MIPRIPRIGQLLIGSVMAAVTAASVAAWQPGEVRPPRVQPPTPGAGSPDRQPEARPSRRGVPGSRDEWRQRLTQRRDELGTVQGKIDEALAIIESGDVSDADLPERLAELGPLARRYIFSGPSGDGREARDDGGDGMHDGARPGTGGRSRGPWSPRGEETDHARPVTDEDIAAAITWIEEHMPRLAERVRELRKSDPEALRRIIHRMRPRVEELRRLAAEDPGAARDRIAEWQAGMRVVDASRALRDRARSSAPPSEIQAVRNEVRAALVAQFDAQVAIQTSEIEQLKSRLEESQRRLDERRATRDRWIDQRLVEIESGRERRGGPDSSGRK